MCHRVFKVPVIKPLLWKKWPTLDPDSLAKYRPISKRPPSFLRSLRRPWRRNFVIILHGNGLFWGNIVVHRSTETEDSLRLHLDHSILSLGLKEPRWGFVSNKLLRAHRGYSRLVLQGYVEGGDWISVMSFSSIPSAIKGSTLLWPHSGLPRGLGILVAMKLECLFNPDCRCWSYYNYHFLLSEVC